MKRLRGFTIIELLVIVVVIGVLASISVVGFSRYQTTTRDAQRAAKATVIAEALEKYYEENGEYPGCVELTGDAFDVIGADGALESVDYLALITPQGDEGDNNSIECSDLTSIEDDDIFAYVGDGSATCTSGSSCLEFSLKYKDELTGEIAVIESRRTTDIDTSGAISDLAATTTGLSRISVSWSPVANASSYRLQRATNAGFSADVFNTDDLTSTSHPVTGLSQGTTYYFRVLANASTGQSAWSNTDSSTTQSLSTPSISATAVSGTQVNTSWADQSSEDSYRFQYRVSGDAWSNDAPYATTLAANTTSRSVSGLQPGVTYDFRVRAQKTEDSVQYNSSYSTTSETTFVPAPSSMTATTNSTTQITADWSDVSGATSYTLEYSTSSGFSSASTITGITSSVRAVTGLTQGERYYFRAYALVGSTSSTASPSDDAVTNISNPTGVNVTAHDTGSVRPYSAGHWIQWNDSPASGNWYYAWGQGYGTCPSGTTRQFRFGANYTSPTTFLGWTGWETTSTKYRVSPSSGYGIRFHVNARCVGSDATSGTVSAVSGYVY